MASDKCLLMHWWHYYAKGPYTSAELDEFEKVIDEYGTDKLFEVAVATMLCGDGSPTVVLGAIRKNCVEKLISTLPKIDELGDGERKAFEDIKAEFKAILAGNMSD